MLSFVVVDKSHNIVLTPRPLKDGLGRELSGCPRANDQDSVPKSRLDEQGRVAQASSGNKSSL